MPPRNRRAPPSPSPSLTPDPATPTPASRYPSHLSKARKAASTPNLKSPSAPKPRPAKPTPTGNNHALTKQSSKHNLPVASPSTLPAKPHPSLPNKPSLPSLPPKPPTSTSKPNNKAYTSEPPRSTQTAPSRSKPKPKPRAYPAPSIDHTATYTSLEALLTQAGYKDTRVFTPEAEKTRRVIRHTLAEADRDEVEALYGAFGFTPKGGERQGGREHRVVNVTEPTVPLGSSAEVLRRMATLEGAVEKAKGKGEGQEWWWTGGTGVLGRAAKAVMELSPPSKGPSSFEEVARQLSTGIGLGLAKGGEGVRKVKSTTTWDLESSKNRDWTRDDTPEVEEFPARAEVETEEVAQEERPPTPEARSPSPEPEMRCAGAVGHNDEDDDEDERRRYFASPPPPKAVEEDAFGYCPLPEDYEAQCSDDADADAMFGTMTDLSFRDIDSLGSGTLSLGSEEALVDVSLDRAAGMLESMDSEGMGVAALGKRIMEGAVEYDDDLDDSPVKSRPPRQEQAWTMPIPEGNYDRPIPRRASTSPSPEPESSSKDEDEVQPKPKLKYADRSLRLAKSTPALQPPPTSSPDGTWLGTFRSLLAQQPACQPVFTTDAYVPTSSAPAPIRLTPAVPALPAVVMASPVVCDSSSTDAEDLPAFPPVAAAGASRQPEQGVMGGIALRLRPSFAKLRATVGWVPTRNADGEDSTSPTLSPRLDWGEQDHFAGWWSPAKASSSSSAPPEQSTPGKGMIDYTKSFFYKPPTPDKDAPPPSADSSSSIASSSSSISSTASRPAAKRQRSIKSLRAALLLPVAPPVPAVPAQYLPSKPSPMPSTPKMQKPQPPILAITSPGAFEAGLPPRELVLEGEEWDAREGGGVDSFGRRLSGAGAGIRKKGSKKGLKKKRSVEGA